MNEQFEWLKSALSDGTDDSEPVLWLKCPK